MHTTEKKTHSFFFVLVHVFVVYDEKAKNKKKTHERKISLAQSKEKSAANLRENAFNYNIEKKI